MIVDWYTHCLKVLKSNHLDREDPSDNKSFFKQEVIYLRFLSNILNYDRHQVNEKWLQLDNGIASEFIHDKEQLITQFNKLYTKAKSNSYSFVDKFTKPLEPINITRLEIKKLNSVQGEKWVKDYLLGLLVYYKFMNQIKANVEYSPTLSNWILRQVKTNKHFRSYRDARGSIMKVIRESTPRPVKFSPIQKGGRYTTYSMPTIIREESDSAATITTLEDITKCFSLLRDSIMVCPECGKVFELSPKAKTNLCPECYKKYRRKYKTMKDREYYYKAK